MFVENKLKV